MCKNSLPVTICSVAGKVEFCLNSKSPRALDRARLPLAKDGMSFKNFDGVVTVLINDVGKLTVYTSKLYKTASCNDSRRLNAVDRLMVVRQRLAFAVDTNNSS